ncbi:uncharacterized protein LAJ45_02930 [Morchella importuna]|uniref:uncharacterized protein n=1 Tax=Morchella importuna TaxID=1174673 RepID=UPI001E8ED193|nr:uncharacterized protein LAJ45_02930 [Morchella importuna]KAH8152706.1 hypothetical protein LAJ45_02930 [Morchella importuna]
MTTAHLVGQLLPITSAELGRLVLNPKKPNQDFIDLIFEPTFTCQITKNFQENYEERRRFSKLLSLKGFLSDICSMSYQKQSKLEATLRAPSATMYDLDNSGKWFESVCSQPSVRKFLETSIDEARSIYLIIGYRTVSDGTLVKKLSVKSNKATGIQGPLSLLPAGITTPVTSLIDPTVQLNQDSGNIQELLYKSPGEQIFAILYRKVKYKFMTKRSLESMVLEANNRWKTVWDWRGPASQVNVPNILEVNLVDDEDPLEEEEEDDEDGDEEDTETSKHPVGLRSKSTDPPEPTDIMLKENTHSPLQVSGGRRFEMRYILIFLACICGGVSVYLDGLI